MHHIGLSYGAAGDYERHGTEPSFQYMLATSPRCGSTWLALLLWRTGLLGAPMEYLNFEHSGGIVNCLGGGDVERYWAEVRRRRTSPNGIFGFKIFVGNYRQTIRKCPDLLPSIFANEVIYLTRKDKIAQAVSHSRAMQSGAWFAGAKERAEPVYDFQKILRWYRMAHWQERQWEKLFSLTGTDPIRLIYEEVVADPDSEIDRVCEAFGIKRDPAAVLTDVVLTRPQSGRDSKEWHERFSEELEKSEVESRKTKLAA